jgi:hypothetical protein
MERVGEVARVQHDPARRVGGALHVGGDVAFGPGASQRIGLDRVHPGPRHLLPDGQRDRAGPGAQVGHHRLGDVHVAQLADGPAGHDLGLRPRHEHAGPDVELEVAEVGPAGDVLQRLTRGPAGNIDPETRVKRRIGHRVQLAAPDVVHVGRDQLGVGPRRFDPGLGQSQRGERHLIKQQAHRCLCRPAS